jgi:hypothetical protein
LNIHRIAQNEEDLLLERAAIARSATLELALDRLFEVANNQLRHRFSFLMHHPIGRPAELQFYHLRRR